MKRGFQLVIFLNLAFSFGCYSLTDVTKSHIEANVPPSKVFDELLRRDLNSYFCLASRDCEVDYELLRDGPTQSGTSYPKFYLWVKIRKENAVAEAGAVRIAAVEQKLFHVTDFVSREEISRSPSQIASIFPAALVNKITEKARSSGR